MGDVLVMTIGSKLGEGNGKTRGGFFYLYSIVEQGLEVWFSQMKQIGQKTALIGDCGQNYSCPFLCILSFGIC